MSVEQVLTMDQIAAKFPVDVLGQRVFKCKVTFLDVDRRSENYSPRHQFSANFHEYLVIDGSISYMPEEAYSALNSAVSYIAKPATKKQAEDGIDADDPSDKYEKVTVKRFEVTVLDIIEIVQDESGKKRFVSSSEQKTENEIIATKKAIEDAIRKELEEDMKEERLTLELRIKELEGKLDSKELKVADDIDDLLKDAEEI